MIEGFKILIYFLTLFEQEYDQPYFNHGQAKKVKEGKAQFV